MTIQTISTPPTAPSQDDPTNFADRADAFLAWFATLSSELNAFADDINTIGSLLTASLTATATGSLTIGTGSKSLTADTGKGFAPGTYITCARTASASYRMMGVVTSYDSTTGALVFTSEYTYGAGTFSDWSISPASPPPTAPSAVAPALLFGL